MSTPLRALGRNGPLVPALGFGLMSLSHATYGTLPSDEERFAVLDRAFEIGATFWDTADLYGDGEAFVGQWFKKTGHRDRIFLATKFGYLKRAGSFHDIDSSAKYCKEACEASLRALGTDYIDLYYAHNVNTDTPIEETMTALAELQAAGKIKHIGLSMISANTLRRAVAIAPVAAVQVGYSLFTRDIEGPAGTNLFTVARELGVAIVAATPLDRGLMTPTFSNGLPEDAGDIRSAVMPRFSEANATANRAAVARLADFAKARGWSVPQVSLAWLLKQGDDVIPIPGTKRKAYLEDNWAALGVTLTDKEEMEIRGMAEGIAGGHTPEAYKSMLFRDTREPKK
ncbi:putative aldo-keto reductase [Plectosphaerella plurivora]|uniref:Aldo-keto reductase n=1 Tax=Plectosphaerella plurivora TaxID=936078 RepID=A0A9P8V7P9_9PEZI|nr:putative aldo-keto reductase [Plectosphaerella plurivora]